MTAPPAVRSPRARFARRAWRAATGSPWSRYLLVTVVVATVTVAATWPYAQRHSDLILGDGSDVPLSARTLWALDRQGGNPFTTARDLLLAAPDGVEVSRATNAANALFTASVWGLGRLIGFAEAFNVYALVMLVLSGTAAFVLLDRLRFGVLAAAFGAYVFAFNPNHIDKAFGHAPLAATWILPVVVLALLAKRRRPTALRAAGAGLLLAVAFYLNSYLGLFALFAAFVFAIVDYALRGEGRSRYDVVRSYYFLALAFLLGLIPLGVSWYFDPSSVSSLASARAEVFPGGSAEPQLYLLPGPRHPLLGGPMSEWLETHLSWEYTMFFGYTTIALALAGVVLAFVRSRRHALTHDARFVVVFAVALTLVGVWASLPPKVHVGDLFEVPTASYFIREATTLYRVFSRFGVLVGLGLVILAAYALSSLPRQRYRAAFAGAALAVVAFELYVGPPRIVEVEDIQTPVTVAELARSASSRPILMDISDPPEYLAWLREQPPGYVADYPSPLSPSERWAWKDVFYQYFHEHPLWQGDPMSRRSVGGFDELADDLEGSLAAHTLAVAGVRYVVVHSDRYRASDQSPPVAPCGLERLAAFPADDVVVYGVSARPDQAFAVRDDGFHAIANRRAWPENEGFRWMPGRSTILLYSPRDDRVFLSGVAVSVAGPRELDVYDSSGEEVGAWEIDERKSAFRFALEVRQGFNRFFFVTIPAAVRTGGDPRARSIAVSSLTVAPVDQTAAGSGTREAGSCET